nr:SEL1-like repeat protein [Deltaproteobacteria bacterium]
MMRRSAAALLFLSLTLGPTTAFAQGATVEFLVERCHAGDVASCALAGARYQLGRNAPQNLLLAGELYTRGCDGNSPTACGLLGGLYSEGRGVTRDDARAVLLFRRGCAGGHTFSCGQLGLMMTAARGTPRDIPGAAPYLERGCSVNHNGACEILGRMLLRGIGVPSDPARGHALLQAACARGSQSACVADTGGTVFAAPPPVTGGVDFAAPPPVVAATPTFTAPPPVVVATPRPRVAPTPRTRVVYTAPPPRPTYTYRRPGGEYGSGSSSPSTSSVALLGGELRATMFFVGYEVTLAQSDNAGRAGFFGAGFRLARGPIEFGIDARYGGGTLAPSVARSSEWDAFVLGAGLGANLLSWPRADRESFSIINLSGGLNTSVALADTNGGSAFRLGGYVANTIHVFCSMGVRTEFTGSLVGADTWGHSLYVSLYFGGRPSSQCR